MWREIAGCIWNGKDPGIIKNRRDIMKIVIVSTVVSMVMTGVTDWVMAT
jgi:hypothetical protein